MDKPRRTVLATAPAGSQPPERGANPDLSNACQARPCMRPVVRFRRPRHDRRMDFSLRRPLAGPLAAIDMGSNSFRLEIGQLQHGRYRRIDYLKETVRLGAGLDANGLLTDEATQRGLACLRRFAHRLPAFTPAAGARGGDADAARGAQPRRLPGCARRRRWASRSRSSRAAKKRA